MKNQLIKAKVDVDHLHESHSQKINETENKYENKIYDNN
jgi:hypothetical protein